MRTVVGLVCTALAKSVSEVRVMKLSDVVLLDGYWARFPPTHVSVYSLLTAFGGRRQERKWRVMEDVPASKAREMRESIERQMRGEVIARG